CRSGQRPPGPRNCPGAGGLQCIGRRADRGQTHRRNRGYSGLSWPGRNDPSRRSGADATGKQVMTLHDKSDALNAERMATGAAAREAARATREADDATKTKALRQAARAIRAHASNILAANAKDLETAKAAGMATSLQERLALNSARIEAMAKGV